MIGNLMADDQPAFFEETPQFKTGIENKIV
ncbi:hypothetical protein HmCmsJML031_03858 [Escherichia coli]|nr:hypothetical protein HmCmsJML031_03858 [Escherichia coli]